MCRIAPQASPESRSRARLFGIEEDWMKYLENGEYLCAVEISTKQNYNMIDGKRNNIETPKEAKPGKDKISLLERLKEKQQLLISGARKRIRKRKASAICRKQFGVWDDVMSIVPYLVFYFET